MKRKPPRLTCKKLVRRSYPGAICIKDPATGKMAVLHKGQSDVEPVAGMSYVVAGTGDSPMGAWKSAALNVIINQGVR